MMHSVSEATDPFLHVQADVLATLQIIRPLFLSYLRIRSLATSPSNPELQQARTELESTLHDLSADLGDLVESVHAIEHDPYRFGLELDEVERRRKLVQDVGDEIDRMREELNMTASLTAAATGGGGAARSTNRATTSAGALPNPSDFDGLLSPDTPEGLGVGDNGEDYFSHSEQQQQVELMQAQDQQLDGVFRTVGSLRQQADDMGRELEDQVVLLDEVDTLADRVGGKLQNGVKRVGQIVKKNEDTISSFCIAVLICVLILLLILVIIL